MLGSIGGRLWARFTGRTDLPKIILPLKMIFPKIIFSKVSSVSIAVANVVIGSALKPGSKESKKIQSLSRQLRTVALC